MSKRAVKKVGLIAFVCGFILFNTIPFALDFRLTSDHIDQSVGDSLKSALLKSELREAFGTNTNSIQTFLTRLDKAFAAVNKAQLDRFKITDQEIQKILELSENRLTDTALDSVFRVSNQTAEFKRQSLKDYGASLQQNSSASRDEYERALRAAVRNIESYGIISKVGFDRYSIKELRFTLTKKASTGFVKEQPFLGLLLTYGLAIIGAMMYILPRLKEHEGIQNNHTYFDPMKNTGWLGILTGTWLIIFYVLLYFYAEYMTGWVSMVDPISKLINGNPAGKFFSYGFIYTLCILVMGVRFMIHYRHSKYHVVRTISVMFFQVSFAFMIPEILVRLNNPYYDFKNIWPLDYSFFFDYRLSDMIANGTFGIFILFWGIALIVIAVPVLSYFFGKRWYCSWVCGCGGLAETLGDPYRHLSQKSLAAWKIERWTVHGVLLFAIIMTGLVLYTFFTGASRLWFVDSYTVREIYGVAIGSVFAGVVGTGFYPLMGNRVWCRYGCPLAAYIGLVQRFKSRFRITTNGGQCISCGNCSVYCEMGIDVRWYAQRGQNVIRASCVGCGICASVCPRGVLKLEVKDEKGRFGEPILLGNNLDSQKNS